MQFSIGTPFSSIYSIDRALLGVAQSAGAVEYTDCFSAEG